MESNQLKYIKYAVDYANRHKIHIWLGGSFLNGTATKFSDVDISVRCNSTAELTSLIYGYGKPIYISYTTNPPGILIVIYEDGVALDLEIIESMDVTGNAYFHRADIKTFDYVRNENICKQLAFSHDLPYQISRLFHRSLIKYLSGKRDIGVSVVNEIRTFLGFPCRNDLEGYKREYTALLCEFTEQFPMQHEYYKLLCELTESIDSQEQSQLCTNA